MKSLIYIALLYATLTINHAIAQQNPFLCPLNQTTNDLDCAIESGQFSDLNQTIKNPQKDLYVTSYNVDRNGYGGDGPNEKGIDGIVNLFQQVLQNQDVIVMSELARDCKSYGNFSNGPLEIAKRLKLNYAYAVEYIEYSENVDNTTNQCTIGNGIFSQYPLNNITQLRFQSQCCMFSGRAGGRITLSAFIQEYNLALYSVHLESGQSDIKSVIYGAYVRYQQANEIRQHAINFYGNNYNILVAGDFNAPILGDFDPVISSFLIRGYKDTHSSISYFDRDTCPFDSLSNYYLFVFDYFLFKSNNLTYKNPQICNQKMNSSCYGLSDHYPITIQITQKQKN